MMSQKLICLVDLENRTKLDLNGFVEHSAEDVHLVVVGGPTTQKHIKKIKPSSRVMVISASSSRDQRADKLILAKLGQYVEREKECRFVIVSEDKEFRACVRDLGYENVTCSPNLPDSVPSESILKIAEKTLAMYLRRGEKKRPKTKTALIQSIAARNRIAWEMSQKVVAHLAANGLIRFTEKGILFGGEPVAPQLSLKVTDFHKYEDDYLFAFDRLSLAGRLAS